MVLNFPVEYEGVEVCIAQPGVVTHSATWSRVMIGSLFRLINVIAPIFPTVDLKELSKAVLNQVVQGFDVERLSNADIVRLGQADTQVAEAGDVLA